MKTITERDGKNVNMQVVGDLHKYPDGSVHTIKNGKDVWEEGGGGSGGSVSPEQIEAAVEAYLAEHPAPQGPKGDTGNTYTLTNQDKQDIAGIVVNLIPSAESEAY